MAETDLALIAQEWVFSLRAKHLSESTIRSYLEAVRLLDNHLGAIDLAEIGRQDIEKFLIAQSERGCRRGRC